MNHAPLPYIASEVVMNDGNLVIDDADNCIVALIPPSFFESKPLQQANAEFITKAANMHQAMVDALRELTRTELYWQDHPQKYAAQQQARALLAQADDPQGHDAEKYPVQSD